jgi:NAD(P)-dependent dehydrogenase (short-subunit alcohol dehydrogenase family)
VAKVYPSELSERLIKEWNADGWQKSNVPLQRAGTSDDMAGVILFLTAPAGAYINGNVLVTDGGRLSVIPASY